MSGTAEIIDRCEALFNDLDFTSARDWKAAEDGRMVIGYLPIYVPRDDQARPCLLRRSRFSAAKARARRSSAGKFRPCFNKELTKEI